MKPRVAYADFIRFPDLDALEHEKAPLLLDGEPVIYAGHHYDTLVWLRRKNNVECYRQADLRGRLRLP